MNFPELGLSEPIVRAVRSEGYTTPTPIQLQAIPHVLAGRDLLGSAQTGTGKTAAFALPVLHRLTHAGNPPAGRGRRIRVLVLSPTRELASQIAQSFRVYGQHTPLRQTTVFGGVSQHSQVRALQHGVDILVATPGRLLDLHEQGYVDLNSIEIFVLDEADRMFDMGFLPDLRRIIALLPGTRQTLFFSATMPPAIAQLANAVLTNPVHVRIAPSKPTLDLIQQSVCFVPHNRKVHLLAKFLTETPKTRAIVFTRTKHGADRVVKRLDEMGIDSLSIHGNKSQNAREHALALFKMKRVQVLVATELAARGIDVDGVTHVFNFDLPDEPESYVHRIGRTGRAGATGIAVSFCDDDERKLLRAIERLTRQVITVIRDLPDQFPTEDASRPEKEIQRPRGFKPAGRRPLARDTVPHGRKPTAAPARPEGSSHRPAGSERSVSAARKKSRRPGSFAKR